MISGTQASTKRTAARMPWTVSRLSAPTLAWLLVAITFATFAHTLRADFVQWDDDELIYANPLLQPATAAHLSTFWLHTYGDLYIPLTYTVYTLLAWLGGGTPHPILYHTANLILHIVTSCLVFSLGRQLVKHDWAAWAGALLFALHPVQVEPIAWAGSLDTLLAGLFSLAALQQYLIWADAEKKSRLRYALASLLYLLALCAKPSAVVVPFMAWILEVGLLRHSRHQASLTLAPWAGVAILWVLVTRHAQVVPMEMVTPLWQRPIIAGDALAFYLAKLVIPWPLGPNYGRSPGNLFHQGLCLTWLAPLGLAFLLWRQRVKFPWLWISMGVFVAALLPVLGFVPFAFQLYSTVADRYLYTAMLGPSLALAFTLAQIRVPSVQKIAVALTIVSLSMYVLLSSLQVRVWNNSLALFSHAIAVNPQSAVMHYNLGNVLVQEGEKDAAAAQFQQAIALIPMHAETHCNLAAVYVSQGRISEAIVEYQTALRINPGLTQARDGLAIVLQSQSHH